MDLILQIPQAIWDALVQTLNSWATGLSDQATAGVQQDLQTLVQWIKTVSFITTLPMGTVDLIANKLGVGNSLQALLDACVGTALLFAAIGYSGHYAFGWPHIARSLQSIGIAIVLVKISQQLTTWTVDLSNQFSGGLAAALPDNPFVPPGGNPVLLAVMEAFWVFLLLRLVITAGKLIVWLMVLKPIAGLAFLTFMHSKSAWLGQMWVRLWVGFLVGHFLLVLGVFGAVLLIGQGGFEGFVLSAAALMVAREAVYVLAPNGSDPLFAIGPVRVG